MNQLADVAVKCIWFQSAILQNEGPGAGDNFLDLMGGHDDNAAGSRE